MSIRNIFSELEKIAKEKNVSKETIIDILKTSIEKAYLKENPDAVFEAILDPAKETIKLYEKRVVVNKNEDEIDDDKEINLEDALKENKDAKLGDIITKEIDIKKFERRVASHVAQVLNQNLNEISSKRVYEEWKDKVGFIIKAEVEKNDDRLAWVNLGDTKGVVLKGDQIPHEMLEAGKSYLFLIKKVEQQSKGWQIILSRADERLLKYILTNEVSEIKNGIIQIKKIARIVGFKTKVAVIATQDGIDAVGTTVGPRGDRIKNISNQLNNERIDVILFDEDPRQFLVNACHPEKIIGLEISDDEDNPNSKIVTIVCEEQSLSKLIGKNGINIKLLNKLTGWQIDVISKTIADEDDVKYEDVSHLVSSKVRQPKSSFKSYVKVNKQKEFNNTFTEDTTFDLEYEAISGITDEDVENLINFDSGNNSKKKKKNKEDDEEIVLVGSGGYDIHLDENGDEIFIENNEEMFNDDANEDNQEFNKQTIVSDSNDDFQNNVEIKQNDEHKNTKTKKETKSKKSKNSKKDDLKTSDSLDELLNETDDLDYQEEENNVDDLDNLELDEE